MRIRRLVLGFGLAVAASLSFSAAGSTTLAGGQQITECPAGTVAEEVFVCDRVTGVCVYSHTVCH